MIPSGVIKHGVLENGPLKSVIFLAINLHLYRGFSSPPCLMKPEGILIWYLAFMCIYGMCVYIYCIYQMKIVHAHPIVDFHAMSPPWARWMSRAHPVARGEECRRLLGSGSQGFWRWTDGATIYRWTYIYRYIYPSLVIGDCVQLTCWITVDLKDGDGQTRRTVGQKCRSLRLSCLPVMLQVFAWSFRVRCFTYPASSWFFVCQMDQGVPIHPLVMTNIAMENHHFQENPP